VVEGLWNYASKVADLDRAVGFYVATLGAEVRIESEVLGCRYVLIQIGTTRIIRFERSPYEDLLGTELPLGFLHDVYEVDDFDAQIARLRAAGVGFIIDPRRSRRLSGAGRSRFSKRPTACAPKSRRSSRMRTPERRIRPIFDSWDG
jgi:catechol 2,3-dioxygenase-like lactoylglutathione lyase family enzyme